MAIAGIGDIQSEFLITPQQLRNDYVRSGATPGGAGEGIAAADSNLLVNGSLVAPVTYSYGPTANEDWVIYDVVFGFYCGTGAGAAVWGTTGGALANGVLIQLSRGAPASTQTMMVLTTNMDWQLLGQFNRNDDGVIYDALGVLRFPSVAGEVLHGRTTDLFQVVIRDNLTAAGTGTAFAAYVRGYKMRNY